MTMTGWRFMYWAFFAIHRSARRHPRCRSHAEAFRRQRTRILIGLVVALTVAGLAGPLKASAAGPMSSRRVTGRRV
jgi:hypothetical protein